MLSERQAAFLLAITNEIDAKLRYERIASMVKNFVLKDKCEFLAREEEKHRIHLEELFKRVFDTDNLGEPAVAKKKPDALSEIESDATVPELLEVAMGAELESEKFYKKLAESSEDEPTRNFFNYLASVEQSHYYLVKAEYEIAKEDETYYSTADTGYWPGMTHVGP